VTPQEYRAAIAELHLTQSAAGKFLGVTPRHSRKWIAGEHRIPKSVDLLLRLMLHFRFFPEEVETYTRINKDG
jgi:hypothetical protein